MPVTDRLTSIMVRTVTGIRVAVQSVQYARFHSWSCCKILRSCKNKHLRCHIYITGNGLVRRGRIAKARNYGVLAAKGSTAHLNLITLIFC
jgi:hypothetical protein